MKQFLIGIALIFVAPHIQALSEQHEVDPADTDTQLEQHDVDPADTDVQSEQHDANQSDEAEEFKPANTD